MISEQLALEVIGSVQRFPAFAKPASAGEARSDKIMRTMKEKQVESNG
jgi:hypothetical protein